MRGAGWLASFPFLFSAFGLGCSCSGDEDASPPQGTGGGWGDAGAEAATGGSGGSLPVDGSSGCTSNADCDGGVCLPGGACCVSAERACGEACCNVGDACLFGQCVTPGQACITQADCSEGEYCEPALGEPGSADAGVPDAGPDGAVCTQAIPPRGRCVPAPVLCDDKGEPAGCIEPCEYHPEVGLLHTVEEWTWGADALPAEYPGRIDVWSTPTVARVYDANCDGEVDSADPPNIMFVSGNSNSTFCSDSGDTVASCRKGVLRMLDGSSGQTIWSLAKAEPTSAGFAGMSVAVGDLDGDESLDIVAMTGEGRIAAINADGTVKAVSTEGVAGGTANSFGWGGGISLGDMDNDGLPEIAYGRSLFTYTAAGEITLLWNGAEGMGGANVGQALSHFVDLDDDGDLELLAGRTAYHKDGTTLWSNPSADGYTGIGDFDTDGDPDIIVIFSATARILRGADGTVLLGPVNLPGVGDGGPPTVADFDGDGSPEIGVAQKNFYTMLKPDFVNNTIDIVWSQTNHDMSSSVTGSSVFDFQGDGKAEVIYNDECYLWVYDGSTGDILYTDFTQSFTATEASIVADVDGDGHAELVKVANGADPKRWTCDHHNAPGLVVAPHTEPFPVWEPSPSGAYRGITVIGDAENAWVGTRTLWNQHVYEVTNVCDPRDSACEPGSYYGQIPTHQQPNWKQSWLNNFRQNVQDKGVFDAPDVTVSLSVLCASPVPLQVSVRNLGLSGLPAGIQVGLYTLGASEQLIGTVTTTSPLLPGQTQVLTYEADNATTGETFIARVLIDPQNPTFHECRDDNNESAPVTPACVQ